MASYGHVLRHGSRAFQPCRLQQLGPYSQKCYSSAVSSVVPTTSQQSKPETQANTEVKTTMPNSSDLFKYRFMYPEFLPDPTVEFRNSVREKIERMDMIKRRTVLHIPEFYVGSIMAVTVSDVYAPGKQSKFVGICIFRVETGLRASFTLRNVVDNQGVEIMYHLYNPCIQKIEVLKLEKRLDDHLLYLRDALPEYTTFPLDMKYHHHPEGSPVPVNPIKVKLKPRPWYCRWERMNLNGIQDLGLPERFYKRAKEVATPYVKYDMMREYRKLIPEEQQAPIWEEVHEHHQDVEKLHKKTHIKKFLSKPLSKKFTS